jgi:hypothetical protein
MRELILVSMSALLGYIVFSAFSSSETPKEALQKIIEQPYQNQKVSQEVASSQLQNKYQTQLISLENQRKLNELKVYEKIILQNKKNETEIKLKELNNELNHKIAVLQVESTVQNKNKNSITYIILALLLFILIFIALKYKKQLNRIELEKKERYYEMMAKKEYAEKILAHISTGNLSFETEKKLLNILDELNAKTVKPYQKDEIYHPNPDIIQLSGKSKTHDY